MALEKEKKGWILLVEDDPGTCALEAQRLKPLGLEIRRAHSAGEAQAALQAGPPELMLLDYSLPGTNALELIKALNASGRPVPPFIVVTGCGDEAVAVAAMKAGACDYLMKTANFLEGLLPAVRKALENITLRRELEAAQKSTAKNLHLYTFLSQVNLAAARIKNREELFREICEVAAAAGGLRMAWIGLPDRDLGRIVPFCWAGHTAGYLDRLRVDLGGATPEAKGPTGRAASGGRIATCPDIAADAAMALWRDMALERGYRSSAAIPLTEGGVVVAVLSLYSGQPLFFAEDELKLLGEIQADISLALGALAAEKERARVQAGLERTATQLSHLLETNPVILFMLRLRDSEGIYIEWVSGNAQAITGYEPAEILAPGWFVTNLHPLDRDWTLGEWGALGRKGVVSHDFRFRKKDGTWFWVHAQGKVTSPETAEVTGSWTDITQLKESELRFRELFENAPVAYQSLDAEGRLTEVNGPWAEVFGRGGEEAPGLRFADLLEPEYRDDFTAWFEGLKKAGAAMDAEFGLRLKAGAGRCISLNGRVSHNRDGGFRAAHCVVIDITEKKELEKRARRDSVRLESLASINAYQPRTVRELLDRALAEALVLTGSGHGCIYHYSEEKKEFTLDAWSREALEGCAVHDPKTVYRLEDTGLWGEPVRQRRPIMVNDFAAPNPLKKGYPEGHVRLANYMSVPVMSGDNIVAVVGVANKPGGYTETDLSQLTLLMEGVWKIVERREARETLAESEARLKALVDAVPEGIIVRRGREIVYINSVGLAVLKGAAPGEFIGRDILERLPKKYHPRILERMRQTEEEGKTTPPLEIQYGAEDGSLLDLEISGAPINFAGEKCAVVFFLDISERKKAGRMMAEMTNMQRVESLGALAGGIAHDFNNMLTGIMANLSLLNSKIQDAAAREIVRDTLEAAHSAQKLTTQLLAFAKGGRPVKKEFPLCKALEEIFSLATSGAGAACRLELAGDLWSVEGDENQLKQAVNNLLVNGLQAMPGGGELRLKAGNLDAAAGPATGLPPGKYVRIQVSDTGIGVPKEYLGRIFEPYFTTKEKGHGLGLSMAWSVITNHGGRIKPRSVPGMGCEFEILLPATGRRAAEEAERPAAVVNGQGRILLLEDDEIVMRAARRMLQELGYTSEVTVDGRETLKRYAEEKAAGRPFAAVIMDLTIPGGMGGKEAGGELRRLHPEAVIIVSSGYSDEAVMADYKAFGFDAVLPKPYRFEDLAEVLSNLTRKKI